MLPRLTVVHGARCFSAATAHETINSRQRKFAAAFPT
jgi:hypothetical protein